MSTDKKQIADTKMKEAGDLYGDAWKHAISTTDDGARHDIPALTLHRLMRLNNLMQSHFNTNIEKQFDVSLGEFRLIMTLGRMVKAASHEIAMSTGISTMNISRAVASMTKRGYISLEVDQDNKRRKILKLTDAGLKKFNTLDKISEGVAKYMMEDFEPQEVETFSRMVAQLINKIAATDSDGESLLFKRSTPANE